MTLKRAAPFFMGALMGPMMLAMLHGQLTSDGVGGTALLIFLAAHLVLGAIAIAGTVFALRLSPKWRARLDRLHRPSLHHLGAMAGTAAVSALGVHLIVHGGL